MVKQAVLGIVNVGHNQQIVLVKRRDVPIWVLPGGGVDENETPEQAIIREVLEETGLCVRIIRKTGEYTPLNKLCHFTHVFECEIIGGQMTITEETRAIQTFSLDSTPPSFLLVHKEWLEDARRQLPETIKKPITSVTYRSLIGFFFRHPILLTRAILARAGFPINTGD